MLVLEMMLDILNKKYVTRWPVCDPFEDDGTSEWSHDILMHCHLYALLQQCWCAL